MLFASLLVLAGTIDDKSYPPQSPHCEVHDEKEICDLKIELAELRTQLQLLSMQKNTLPQQYARDSAYLENRKTRLKVLETSVYNHNDWLFKSDQAGYTNCDVSSIISVPGDVAFLKV